MARPIATLRLDLKGLRELLRDLDPGGPASKDMHERWAARYLGFARRRYTRQSRGGGDWPPLKPATVARRRYRNGKTIGGARQAALKRARRAKSTGGATRAVRGLKRVSRAAGKAAILRDTGTLFGQLDVGLKTNRKMLQSGRGIKVGIISRRKAASGEGRSSLSVAKLAAYHQSGSGNNPKREIIVMPNEQTKRGMLRDAHRSVGQSLRRNRIR